MRKKHPEHVNLERWLVSYADFITLLFAFFVIMYAISQADMAKSKRFTDGVHKAFSSGPIGMVDLGGSSGGKTVTLFEAAEAPGGRAHDLPAGKTNTSADPDPALKEIQERLEETISLEMGAADTSEKLQMQFDSRGLIVRLATKDFFGAGESEVTQDLRPMLDRIGRVLSKTNRLIRIEGHSEPYEIKTNDWQLSTDRAAWVARYWMQRFGIPGERLAVAGYGPFRLVSTGTEEWQRAKNRRVEFIILNNQYETH